MTKEQAAKIAIKAMLERYEKEEDTANMTSWEMRDMLIEAVRAAFMID